MILTWIQIKFKKKVVFINTSQSNFPTLYLTSFLKTFLSNLVRTKRTFLKPGINSCGRSKH